MEAGNKLTVVMTPRETRLGWLYLGLELFLLPGLLSAGNRLLPRPVSNGWLNFIFFFLNFAAVWLIFRDFLTHSLRQARKQPQKLLFAALAGFALYWAASFLLATLPVFDVTNVNDAAITAMAREEYLPVAVGTVVLVPLAEETLFRGLLFQGFYNRNPWAAYAVSTLAFCAIHVAGYVGRYPIGILALCFVQYIPAGLSLAWAYAKADCIFAPIFIHTAINAIGIYAAR